MPFCSQCGNQVAGADVFCSRCGGRQHAGPSRTSPGADPLAGINPRTASIFCYIPGVGWIASIIVLASDRFRHDRAVRFHAFQGLYLFVAWLLEERVLRPVFGRIPGFHFHGIIEAVLLGMAIFMMVKASHDEAYALPLLGELARKSLTED
jgi:uncharacterized membrane protein